MTLPLVGSLCRSTPWKSYSVDLSVRPLNENTESIRCDILSFTTFGMSSSFRLGGGLLKVTSKSGFLEGGLLSESLLFSVSRTQSASTITEFL